MFETTNQVSLFHQKNPILGTPALTSAPALMSKLMVSRSPSNAWPGTGEGPIFEWEVPMPGYPNNMFYQKNVGVFFWGFLDVWPNM